jgi:hypothetical protein
VGWGIYLRQTDKENYFCKEVLFEQRFEEHKTTMGKSKAMHSREVGETGAIGGRGRVV